MSVKFDCMCCCETLPIVKCISCPSNACGFQVCIICQKTTLSLAHGCMSCKMTFKNKFLVEKLGKTFVNGPLRKYNENPLFEREKALLPETQPLVEWERIRRTEMAKTRFRQIPQIPPRPVIGAEGSNQDDSSKKVDPLFIVFPCPKNTCRGFVIRGRCGVCTENICVLCRELKKTNHVCDKNAVENVSAINTECKSCPQCASMIFRTKGCDHMKCTACNSHFDWQTGRLLKISSNHHYDNAATFAVNIAIRGREVSDGVCEDDRDGDLLNNHIPRDVFEELFNATNVLKTDIKIREIFHEFISVLYDDPDVIRATKTTKFMERNIIAHTSNSLLNDRVKYLMDEINETRWKSRIYTLEKHKDLHLHVAEVLNIYLTTVRDFQSYVRSTLINAMATASTIVNPYNYILEQLTKVKAEYLQFINMINDSFASLQEEYGGTLIKIRDDFSNPHLPAILL